MFEFLNGPPDFTNPEGVKWWHEQALTNHAKQKGLDNVTAWVTELPNGVRMRVLIQDGEIVFENTDFETVAFHIDALALVKDE